MKAKPLSVLLALSLASGLAGAADPAKPAAQASLSKICDQCAIVEKIQSEKRKGEGGAVGMVGGAVVGGLLGNQVGGGRGKTLATVGGAVGGAVAGNEVQKHVNSSTVWITTVTLKDGKQRRFETAQDPGYAPGTVVKVEGNSIKRY